MSGLPPWVLDRLAQRRVRARWVRAVAPSGERADGSTGSGIEFTEHRPYLPGDDLRHLDPNVYARLGAPFVKRFQADRGLDVTLLVDRSASMRFGRPPKSEVATLLASGIASAALASGDRVRIGVFGGNDRIVWQRSLQGSARLSRALAALRIDPGPAPAELAQVAVSSLPHLPPSGVLAVFSDWWTDRPEDALALWAARGQEVVVVHVLSPEEVEPFPDADGPVRLEDAETGDVVERPLGDATRAVYADELASWRQRLRAAVDAVRGRYLAVRSDEDPDSVLLDAWFEEGFLA